MGSSGNPVCLKYCLRENCRTDMKMEKLRAENQEKSKVKQLKKVIAKEQNWETDLIKNYHSDSSSAFSILRSNYFKAEMLLEAFLILANPNTKESFNLLICAKHILNNLCFA